MKDIGCLKFYKFKTLKMTIKKRNLKIFLRVSLWIFYLISGYFLYSKTFILPIFLGSFAKLVYPLSIFWLQIRLKNRETWLPFTDSMSTSQLWFRLIPILSSLFTFLIVSVNLLLKIYFFIN